MLIPTYRYYCIPWISWFFLSIATNSFLPSTGSVVSTAVGSYSTGMMAGFASALMPSSSAIKHNCSNPARCFCATAATGTTKHASSSTQVTPYATTRLKEMLKSNEQFVNNKGYSTHNLDKAKSVPSRAVIVTCMDTRLTTLLPPAINIRSGDAKIIKTAGAIITHPFGSTMRSVVVALYMLNADEVFVIGHHDCGMSNLDTPEAVRRMTSKGKINSDTFKTLASAGIDVHSWLHGFDTVQEGVRSSVEMVRNHPLIPAHIPVHGLVIDPNTGKLDLVVDGSLPPK